MIDKEEIERLRRLANDALELNWALEDLVDDMERELEDDSEAN